MRRLGVEVFTAVALTLGAILALTLNARAAELAVTSAFARASPTAKAISGAVYLTVRNAGTEPDKLIGISTDMAAMAMLHETVIADGVAKMSMSHDITIPAGGALELSPNGGHIMLEGLKAPLKQGEMVTLTLTFEKAGDVTVKVPIGGVAAMAP